MAPPAFRAVLPLLALCAGIVAAAGKAADLDLILYGADGCVGHFAASHLAKQPALKWAVAGRTEAKLRALVEDLAAQGGNSSRPEVIVAALDGKQDPKAWVSRAKAVINAAGPFSKHGGEFLVAACARAGVHYADTSDEFYWQRRMIDSYDGVARQSGAKLVLSTGFCVMAGDLGAQVAIGALGAAAGSSVSVDAWLETYNGGLSAGVINTKHAIDNASYPKEWNTDPYVLAPTADAALRVDSSVEGMTYPSYVSGEGLVVSNLFGPYDARLMRRTFAKLGQRVKLRVGAAVGLYPKWTAFLATHPGSWSNLTKCPSQSVFEDGSWSYRVKATSAAGSSGEALLSGSGDPGYRFTSWGLAEAGLCLSGRTAGCVKPGSDGGVLTPAAALDTGALRARLESVGLLKVEIAGSAAASAPAPAPTLVV